MDPTGMYLLKINNSNSRKMREVYSKLTIKALANFEQNLQMLFQLLTLNKYLPAGISLRRSAKFLILSFIFFL